VEPDVPVGLSALGRGRGTLSPSGTTGSTFRPIPA